MTKIKQCTKYIANYLRRQFSRDTDLTWQAGPWISAHAQLSCSQEFLHLRRRLGIPCLYIDAEPSIVHLWSNQVFNKKEINRTEFKEAVEKVTCLKVNVFFENVPGLVTACIYVSLSLKIGFGEGGGISILDDGFWWWWTSSDRKGTEGGTRNSSKSMITKPEETMVICYLFHRYDPTSQDPHTEGLWRGGFWEPLVQNKSFEDWLVF